MVYVNNYDDVLVNLKSSKEIEIFLAIKKMFTKSRSEVGFVQSELAKKMNVSRVKVSTIIRMLISIGFIKKVTRTTYRMNPYIYLPYQADGSALQEEWDELMN